MSSTDIIEGLRTRIVRVIHEKTGLHEMFAMPVASEIVDTLFQEFGKERVYFRMRNDSIAKRVVAEFDGTNRDALCRKYRISRRSFYRYLQATREAPCRKPGCG